MLSTFVLFRRELITSRMVISLAFVLSLYVILAYTGRPLDYDVLSLGMLVQMLFQSFIGLISGLILNLVFEVFVSAGQVISTQIGLSMASLIDQRFGYITSLTHFYIMVSTLLFLFLNGHLFAIKAIIDSFTVLPVYQEIIPVNTLEAIFSYAGVIFSGGILLSITIIIVLLLTNIALAVMTKFAPQFNLFSIGINMQLIIGLICIYITFSLFLDNSGNLIRDNLGFLQRSITGMK